MVNNDRLCNDRIRYSGKMPKYQIYYRKTQLATNFISKLMYKILFVYYKKKYHVEFSEKVRIGEGLYIGHPYNITINENAIIGKNCNIHKGVTIGQENRGKRKGAPTIGDEVWIGINCTVVGNIKIGNDVLIAPNSFVNCNIPDHSIVLGNPCRIIPSKHATADYINRKA